MSGIVHLVFYFSILMASLNVRSIMIDHFKGKVFFDYKNGQFVNYRISKIVTFLFGIFYLQYKINRLNNASRQARSVDM